jgi:MFS family permease
MVTPHMPRIHDVIEGDQLELARRLEPRDDAIVAEAVTSTGERSVELGVTGGPFRSYRRTVRWSEATGDRCRIEQEVEYRLAIPYWARLYDPLVRRALRDGVAPGTRPWWTTPDRLSPAQSTMVAAMAMFNLVAGLLYGLLTQVLTFVSADLGDGSAGQQTALLSVVRVGVVITIGAMFLADRRGRRKIAIVSFLAAAVLTVAGAAAPTWWAFGALQFVARNLAIAGLLCVDTISVEELPPGSRAMATGLGALAYGLGAGVIVVSLPLADLGPWGWRLTFVVAGVTLPIIWSARRHLPESARFRRMVSDAAPVEGRRINGSRFVLLAAMFFLFNMFVAPASQLQNDYLRADRGYSGLLIAVFVVLTSTPAGLGVISGGRLADIRGRRAAIVPGLTAFGVFSVVFFSVGGAAMWVASLLASVLGALAIPAMGVIAPELFPTARRGTVRGTLTAIAVGGSVCGLLVAGAVVDSRGYSTAFALLAIAPLAAAGLAFAIPETRGKELEDLNPVDEPR